VDIVEQPRECSDDKDTQSLHRRSARRRIAPLAFASISLIALASPNESLHADPRAYDSPFVGVGSYVTQSFMNAMSGYENGIDYVPLRSSVPTGARQILSFDDSYVGKASLDSCIATRMGGPSFNRPRGGVEGTQALANSLGSGGTFSNSHCGVGATSVSGQVSFARSASLGTAPGDLLAYVPFARTAVSYMAYRQAGPAVTNLSQAELTAIYSSPTGADVTRGTTTVRVYGCTTSSITSLFDRFFALVGAADSSFCDALLEPAVGLPSGPLGETDGDELVARGAAVDAVTPGSQVIVPTYVSAFVARKNGVTFGGMPAAVKIGTISDVAGGAPPVIGAAPNLVGNSPFFLSPWGFDVYNVLPNAAINSAFGNSALKEIFQGTESRLCQQVAPLVKFGFLPIAECGDTTTLLRGA
jgi:hypothetical protein